MARPNLSNVQLSEKDKKNLLKGRLKIDKVVPEEELDAFADFLLTLEENEREDQIAQKKVEDQQYIWSHGMTYPIKEVLSNTPAPYRIVGYISEDGKEFLCRLNECGFGHRMVAYLMSRGKVVIPYDDYHGHIKVECSVRPNKAASSIEIGYVSVHDIYVNNRGIYTKLNPSEEKYYEDISREYLEKLMAIINTNPIGNFMNAIMFDGDGLFEYPNVKPFGWNTPGQWEMSDIMHFVKTPSTLKQIKYKK